MRKHLILADSMTSNYVGISRLQVLLTISGIDHTAKSDIQLGIVCMLTGGLLMNHESEKKTLNYCSGNNR